MKHLPSASCWANQSNLLQRFGERSANHSLQSSRLLAWNFRLPKKHVHTLAEQYLAPYRGYAKGKNSIFAKKKPLPTTGWARNVCIFLIFYDLRWVNGKRTHLYDTIGGVTCLK
jgi:hypothetical protein